MDDVDAPTITELVWASNDCNSRIAEVKDAWLDRISELKSEIDQLRRVLKPDSVTLINELKDDMAINIECMNDDVDCVVDEYVQRFGEVIRSYIIT